MLYLVKSESSAKQMQPSEQLKTTFRRSNFQPSKQGGKCKMKTRHNRKRETNTVATVAHNKYCENVEGLLLAVIPHLSMIFLQVIFIFV